MGYLRFLLLFIFFATHAQADFISLSEKTESKTPHPFSYLAPNEINPEIGAPILKHAGAGVYISVGTERGFMGAIQTPKASHLLLLDMDPQVVKFNRYNIALLKLSKNREDYLHLRLNASLNELKERVKNTSDKTLSALFDQESFQFWQVNVRDSFLFSDFNRNKISFFARYKKNLGTAFSDKKIEKYIETFAKQDKEKFNVTNYLYEDSAFQKIHQMAQEDKIQAVLGNFTDHERLAEISSALKEKNLKVSVIDFSNAWDRWDYPTTPQNISDIMTHFAPVSDENSILYLTVYGQTKSAGYRWKRITNSEKDQIALAEKIQKGPMNHIDFRDPNTNCEITFSQFR